MSKWKCSVCGYIYDSEKGIPEKGIEAGTEFEDLPDDFKCPRCGAGKALFMSHVEKTIDILKEIDSKLFKEELLWLMYVKYVDMFTKATILKTYLMTGYVLFVV